MRIAIVYRYRPWGTGDFLRRALEKHCMTWVVDTQWTKHNWPFTVDIMAHSASKIDAIVAVGLQDGADRKVAELDIPKVFWAMDDPIFIERNLEVAPMFDHVFVAQRDVLWRYESVAGSCSWLPFGCDPIIHTPLPFHTKREEYKYDVVFAGRAYPKEYDVKRTVWLDNLGKKFRVKRTTNVYMQELVALYDQTPIVYNNAFAKDLNMRVFEVLGCQRLLLTDRLASINGLLDIFKDGEDLVTYDSYNELERKVGYYLEHLEEAKTIATNGCKLVHQWHNYSHIAKTIIDKLQELKNGKYSHPNKNRQTAK